MPKQDKKIMKAISRRRRIGALIAMGILGSGGALVTSSAHAALVAGGLVMTYSGVAPFDGDNAAGNDLDAANNVIRSNDSVGYSFNYTTSGGDTNTKVVLTAPTGARWNAIPGGCQSPASSIVGNVLTCVLGNIPNPQTQSINFEMNVGPRANGAAVPAATMALTSDQTTAAVPYVLPPNLVGSAAPRWDAVKVVSGYGAVFRAGSGPGGADGFILPYTIMVRAANYQGRGGDSIKGLAPMGASFTVADALPTPNAVIMNYANPYQTTACVNHPGGFNQWATAIYDNGPNVGSNSAFVANGGSCAVTQNANTATLTLTNVDSSLTIRPTTYAGNGIPLSDIRTTTVTSKNLFVWIPLSDVPVGANATSIVNTLPAATFASQDGLQTYTEAGADLANNSATYPLLNSATGTVGKVSVPWSYPGAVASLEDAPGGVPTGYPDAVNTTVPGSRWKPKIVLNNSGTQPLYGAQICDYFDNARQDLIELSPGIYSNVVVQPAVVPASNYVVEFGTGGALAPNGQWTSVGGGASAMEQATCNDSGVQWNTNPAALPGGVGSVTRIRLTYTGIDGVPTGSNVTVSYGVRMRSTWAYTTSLLGAEFGGSYAAGTSIVPEDRFYSPSNYRIANKMGATWNGLVNTANQPTELTSEVSVGVRKPGVFNSIIKTSVDPVNTSANPVSINQVVKYQLDLFSRNIGWNGPETLTVTDVLPPGLNYVPGSTVYTGNAAQNGTPQAGTGFRGGLPGTLSGEPTATMGAPNCALCTTLIWTIENTQPALSFNNRDGDSLLGNLQFQATVAVQPSGTQLLNSATIDSPYDFATDCGYQDSSIGFAGAGCVKASNKTLVVSSPPGFYLSKTTPMPVVPMNSSMDFHVVLASIGGAVNNARWIDILPYDGDAGIRGAAAGGSNFPGTSKLASLSVPAGVTVSYTKLPPASLNPDPSDASNAALGAVWCAGLTGGACPAALDEVTALRFESATLPADTVTNVAITMQAAGNGAGGFYINNFRATGATNTGSPVLTSQDVRVDVLPTVHTVTSTAGVGGTVGTPTQTVTDGNVATTSVTPDPGYVLDAITTTCGGGSQSNGAYTTSPVHDDCEVHATFIKKTYTVTGTAGTGGSIAAASQTVDYGNTATLTITPDQGYEVDKITTTCEGGTASAGGYTTLPVHANCNVDVTFKKQSVTVTGTAGPGGSIGPGSQTVSLGSAATLAITPATGYQVDQITTTCSGGSASAGGYTTLPVQADCNVNVTFKKPDAVMGQPAPVPTLSESALALLTLFVLGMGWRQYRTRGMCRG